MLKKPSLLYLICAVFILLAFAGFVWFGIKHLPKANPANTNQAVNASVNQSGQIIPPTKTDCADELDTECWQTYRNDEYGFEFKFPREGKVKVEGNNNGAGADKIFDVVFSLQSLYGSVNEPLMVGDYSDITVFSFFIYNSGGKDVATWLKSQLPKFDILKKDYINSHHVGLTCGSCSSLEDLGNFALTHLDFVSNQTNQVVMNYGSLYSEKDFSNGPSEESISRIVSTFEFINQPSGQIIPPTKTDCADELDTECWQTYRNDEYGFEFKFPAGWEADVNWEDRLVSLYKLRKVSVDDSRIVDMSFSIINNKDSLSVEDYYKKNDNQYLDLFKYSTGGYEDFFIGSHKIYLFKDVLGMVNSDVAVILLDGYFIEVEAINYRDLLLPIIKTLNLIR